MKILLVHNDYGKYSGEEAVVDKMTALFNSSGHETVQLRMSTANYRDNLKGKIKGFVAGIYSPEGVKSMSDVLEREKPDVVNVHNLFPFISPAALRECKKRHIPVVMTVHNYRLICPTGLFMRNNMPCELCLKRGNEWGCLKHNCEKSIFKSIGYAARNYVARTQRHFIECVDYFACLTEFQRQKLAEAGFPEEKLCVIPNFIEISDKIKELDLKEKELKPEGEKYVAYSGRISREKGIDLIIRMAWRHPDINFRLAGSVRDKEIVDNIPQNVKLMGHLSGNDLEAFYRDAAFFVMPSRCYEGFPMAILEAAVFSKPVVAPAHGGFPEIISYSKEYGQSGILFTPHSFNSLEEAILSLWLYPYTASRLGENAFAKVSSLYSSERVGALWEALLKKLTTKN